MPSKPPPDFLSLGELAALGGKIDWIVSGMIPSGSFIILGGPPKLASKTFKALHIAECVATGRSYLGQKTKPHRVLYVSLEDGQTRMQVRAHQLGIQPNDPIGVTMFFGRVGLGEAIRRLEQTTDPVLLIVDPLINWLAIGGVKDENDPTQVAPFIELYRSVAQKSGSSILVVDHFDKTWAGIRGSSAKQGSSDGWIEARPVGTAEQRLTRVRSSLRDGKPIEIGVAMVVEPHDCEVCKSWDADDRVQIRLERREATTMPVRFMPTETQQSGDGRGQGQEPKPGTRRASAEAQAKLESDKSLVLALLAQPESASSRMSLAAILDKLPVLKTESRLRVVLEALVSEGRVLQPRGYGPTALGYRLPVGQAAVITAPPPAEPEPPKSNGVVADKTDNAAPAPTPAPIEPEPEPVDQGWAAWATPPTGDEIADYLKSGAAKVQAIRQYARRARIRITDASAILAAQAPSA